MYRDQLLARVRSALETAWSIETSSKWLPENPARGQCGVTALVAQDFFGGDILKTRTGDAWHFYNCIDGRRVDFSEGQFSSPIVYSDLPAGRSEALSDTTPEQYRILRQRLLEKMNAASAPIGLSPTGK